MGLGVIKNGKNKPLAGAVRHNKVMVWSKSVANPYARHSNEDPQPTIPFVFNDIPAGVYVYSPFISGDSRTGAAFGSNIDAIGNCNSYDYSYIEAVPGLEYINPMSGGMRLDWGYEASKHTPFVLHQDVPALTIRLAIGNTGGPDKIYASSAGVKLTRISDVPIEGVRR